MNETSEQAPKKKDYPLYDVVISGGGVVGCLAALSLAKHTKLSVLLLEAHQSKLVSQNDGQKDSQKAEQANTTNTSANQKSKANGAVNQHGFDARVIALANESINLLNTMGVDVANITHQNIEQIHVSDRGHIGQVKLDAASYGIDCLGKVVAIESLGAYLLTQYVNETKTNNKLAYDCPVKIEQIETSQDCQALSLSNSTNIRSKLLLISDGGQSGTAALAGLQSTKNQYSQSAIITNITTQLPHQNIAYERFTSQGPIAFLPMALSDNEQNKSDSAMSIVWCMNKEKAQDVLALSDSEFLARLQHFFSNKLGKLVSCSQKFTYPLALTQAEPFAAHRVICIGNAAQSLHPIAGQGFNLGIRDVYDVIKAISVSEDAGGFEVISRYHKMRTQDKQQTVGATDTLLRVFSNQYEPVVLLRNIGLLGMNKSTIFKEKFAQFAMGKRT